MPTPRRGSLLVIFLTVFVDLLGFGMVIPLLPLYADEYAIDPAGWQLGLLMASFSAMQFLFAPLWGRLSDRIGRRPVLMIGLAGSVVCYLLFGIATWQRSLMWLFVSRIGAGISGATISTAQAYIADVTTAENRSKGMALIGMAFGLGFTFGPLLGFLAVWWNDQAPGYAAAALSAVALTLAVFLLPESLQRGKAAADTPESQQGWLALGGLRQALARPSIVLVLSAIFVCIFSFANFETTLSLLIKGDKKSHGEAAIPAGPAPRIDDVGEQQVPDGGDGNRSSPFSFDQTQVCLTYAYIGFTLALVQGGLVRRLAGRISEGVLAATGAGIEVVGFGLVTWAIAAGSWQLLLGALAVVVTGFSFMQPSLNGLLSRRTDPARQGVVLGLAQSVNSMARILGSFLGIPLLRRSLELPYYAAAGLMALGMLLVLVAAATGKDYDSK